MRASGPLPGHDRPADRPLGQVVIQGHHWVVAVGDQPVPLPVQGRERLFRGFLQARGLRLLLSPTPEADSGRSFSDFRPNGIRCSTATSACVFSRAAQQRVLLQERRRRLRQLPVRLRAPPPPQTVLPHPPHPGPRQPLPSGRAADTISSREARRARELAPAHEPVKARSFSRDFRRLAIGDANQKSYRADYVNIAGRAPS
jgi:hypothetical protein